MYDVIIAGGGPAGLAAGVYAARKKLNTLLISMDIGGQVNTTRGVENYLGYQFIEGAELIDKFYAQIKQFPIEQQTGYKVTKVDRLKDGNFEVTTENGPKYQSKTVLYATGKKPKKLNVPGEAEFMGRGVSYCAVCDGPIFSGQDVAIVGGGNSAVSAVLDMVKIARQVYLFSISELTADPILTEKLAGHKNLSTHVRQEVQNIEGNQFVERITVKDLASSNERQYEVGAVFVETGLTPNSEAVSHLVALNKLGEIPVSCYCETTVPGLFAAGDVTDVPDKQIIIAAGEGAKAVLQLQRYLLGIE